jgi:hypothetical protein
MRWWQSVLTLLVALYPDGIPAVMGIGEKINGK